MSLILYLVFSYLIGSIPFSIIFGRVFKSIDIREYGSKNAGATNAFRILGTKLGSFVLILDLLKGFIPVYALSIIFPDGYFTFKLSELEIATTLLLVLGHIFPIWASFRGGKGVATGAGAVTAIFPPAFIICLAIFFIIVTTTKYVSVGSITSAISLPIIYYFYNKLFSIESDLSVIIFFSIVSIIILLKHKNNIKRLLKGTESRVNIRKK